MPDLPNDGPEVTDAIVIDGVEYVKGEVRDISLRAEAIAPAYLVADKAPAIQAELVALDGRLTPAARHYRLSGLPWDCHVQLNYGGSPDVDRLRLLIETDLAEVVE